jgi:putative endonuclease
VEDHKTDRLSLGRSGEDIAVRHLRKHHYEILDRGVRLLRGEIDIVVRDGRTVVFVEVKTRRGLGYGPPAASVTAEKRRQIRRIAQYYLARRGLGAEFCRFDVISVLIDEDGSVRIEHVKDAF